MKNDQIAKKLKEISRYLEIEDKGHRSFAYRRASDSVLNFQKEIAKIYKKEGKKEITKISGIGDSIADIIEELILTGEVEYLKILKKRNPIDLEDLLKVEGLGPKKIKKLYDSLEIKNIKDLTEKLKEGKIAELDGFGKKTEENILKSINFLKEDEGKWALGEVIPVAEEIFEKMKEIKQVKKINFAGSLRRNKEIIGDIDILISASKVEPIMDTFTSLPNVAKVINSGNTKSSIKTKEGINADLRVVGKTSFGSALQYFTGSREHNISLRKIAIQKGFKLNEYGLFKEGKKVAGKNEKEIYRSLGLNFIPPELRENRGEIEKAKEDDFSALCRVDDLRGDLHIHSSWNGGVNSIEEIVREAEKMGYDYLGIADHTQFLRIENGLTEEDLEKQKEEIKEIDSKITILQGCEANIMKDGSLDISDEALKKLDYVIAGIHSGFKMTGEEITERIIKAIKHPEVNIISHPTGRLIKKREEIPLNFDRILKTAKKENVALEINSSPARLDLNDINVRKAVEAGVKMIINSDTHQKDQMKNIKYGVAQARRGWAKKEDIINSYELKKLKRFLANR